MTGVFAPLIQARSRPEASPRRAAL